MTFNLQKGSRREFLANGAGAAVGACVISAVKPGQLLSAEAPAEPKFAHRPVHLSMGKRLGHPYANRQLPEGAALWGRAADQRALCAWHRIDAHRRATGRRQNTFCRLPRPFGEHRMR